MKILVLEAATQRGVVALVDGGASDLMAVEELPVGLNNSAHLIPAVQSVLSQVGMTVADLDLIACGNGPGSYTGLRVVAALAKSLSFARRIPLVGVSTLRGFVKEPMQSGGFAILDAKISGVYGMEPEEFAEPKVWSLEELVGRLGEKATVITAQAEPLRQRIEGQYPDLQWKWIERYPCPLTIAYEGLQQLHAGKASIDGQLELRYLRKTQAEIERQGGN